MAEAADALGITAEAVRSRIKRDSLETEREAGTVYVLLDAADRAQPVGGRARQGDAPEPDRTDALIDALTGQVEDLREQLHAERQAHGEARRIIAGLVERIPAIEAPSAAEASEDAETIDEQQGRADPRSDAPGAQEGVQRPWWRRVFGG